MIVKIKISKNGGQEFPGKKQTIESIAVQHGLLNEVRKEPAATIGTPERMVSNPKLRVLDKSGKSLYETEFSYPTILTVPPLPGDIQDNIPPVIKLDFPEVSIVVPYFPESYSVQVIDPSGKTPPSSKSISEDLFINKLKENKQGAQPMPGSSSTGFFNVLIMASGFSSESMNVFLTKAASLKTTILDKEPFASQASKLNIHIYQNTDDLGCYTGCNNIDRLLCCNSNAVISAAAGSGYKYDEIIVIHNTSTYAGGGYRDLGNYKSNSYSTYAAVYSGTWTETMVVHEFGHSFGDLCDEYAYGSEGYTYYNCVNCRASCNDWQLYDTFCQVGCDAKTSYFRPGNSIMLSFSYNTYNQASIKATYPPDGLALRLQYFTQAPKKVIPFIQLLLLSEDFCDIAQKAICSATPCSNCICSATTLKCDVVLTNCPTYSYAVAYASTGNGFYTWGPLSHQCTFNIYEAGSVQSAAQDCIEYCQEH